jgi:hypothetical protein
MHKCHKIPKPPFEAECIHSACAIINRHPNLYSLDDQTGDAVAIPAVGVKQVNTHKVAITATRQNYEEIGEFGKATSEYVPTNEQAVASLTVEGSPEFVANIVRAFGDALEN